MTAIPRVSAFCDPDPLYLQPLDAEIITVQFYGFGGTGQHRQIITMEEARYLHEKLGECIERCESHEGEDAVPGRQRKPRAS